MGACCGKQPPQGQTLAPAGLMGTGPKKNVDQNEHEKYEALVAQHYFGKMDMFMGLTEHEMVMLCNNLTEQTFAAGEPICEQFSWSREFYVLTHGGAKVFVLPQGSKWDKKMADSHKAWAEDDGKKMADSHMAWAEDDGTMRDSHVTKKPEAGKTMTMTDHLEEFGDLVGNLAEGHAFGELAFLKSMPRTATVVAGNEGCTVLCIDRKFYDDLGIKHLPEFGSRRRAFGGGFRYNDSTICKSLSEDPSAQPTTEKSGDEKMMIVKALKENKGLQSIPVLHAGTNDDIFQGLADAAFKVPVKIGGKVIIEGSLDAEHMFCIMSGIFEVTHTTKSGKKKSDAKLTEGMAFGELALFFHCPRSASVTCIEDGELMCISRAHFHSIRRKLAASRQDAKMENILQKMDMASKIGPDEKRALADSLIIRKFKAGGSLFADSAFFSDGNETKPEKPEAIVPEECLFLTKGRVVCRRKEGEAETIEGSEEGPPVLGEKSMLKKEAIGATYTAITDCTIYILRRQSVDLLLDSSEAAELGAIKLEFTKSDPEEPKAPKMPPPPAWKDLHIVGLLGAGGFGAVTLQKDRTTNKTYAVKKQSKGYIVETGMEAATIGEKKILVMCEPCPFTIHLYSTHKDTQNLYLVLEPALGGELYATFCNKRLHGKPDLVKFFAAGVMEAFDFMHHHHIVYRDLKPENVILDSRGYGLLTDMGLAKHLGSKRGSKHKHGKKDEDGISFDGHGVGRTYTCCGTPVYFAPEVISGEGHSYSVDWWTLGVFIHELFSGHSPFEDDDQHVTYKKIAKGMSGVPLAPVFSKQPAAYNLIESLCQVKEEDRLTSMAGGSSNIRKHDAFKGFDFAAYKSQTMVSPYIPPVKSEDDMSNFQCSEEDLPPEKEYKDPGTHWEDDF